MFIHLLGHSLIFVWFCYMMILVWELFIPITAKQYYSNPDTIIALICCLWSVMCLSYFVSYFSSIQIIFYLLIFLIDSTDDVCEAQRGFVLDVVNCLCDFVNYFIHFGWISLQR